MGGNIGGSRRSRREFKSAKTLLPQSLRDSVSLRLGHVAALTVLRYPVGGAHAQNKFHQTLCKTPQSRTSRDSSPTGAPR